MSLFSSGTIMRLRRAVRVGFFAFFGAAFFFFASPMSSSLFLVQRCYYGYFRQLAPDTIWVEPLALLKREKRSLQRKGPTLRPRATVEAESSQRFGSAFNRSKSVGTI